MRWIGIVSIVVAVALIALVAAYYAWVYRRNRKLGAAGLVSRSRLTCPHCHGTFDLDYVPGGSFTAIRLGRSRYMACPLCRRWSTFDLAAERLPAGAPPSPGSADPPAARGR